MNIYVTMSFIVPCFLGSLIVDAAKLLTIFDIAKPF